MSTIYFQNVVDSVEGVMLLFHIILPVVFSHVTVTVVFSLTI